MTKLLVSDETILLVEPFEDKDDGFYSNGLIYPKSVLQNYSVIDIELPNEFSILYYKYFNGAITRNSVPTVDEVQFQKDKESYLDIVRALRGKVLSRLNGYGSMLLLSDNTDTTEKQLCTTVIQGLLDITSIPTVEAATDMSTLIVVVKAEWERLVGMASTEMVKAFRKLDL